VNLGIQTPLSSILYYFDVKNSKSRLHEIKEVIEAINILIGRLEKEKVQLNEKEEKHS